LKFRSTWNSPKETGKGFEWSNKSRVNTSRSRLPVSQPRNFPTRVTLSAGFSDIPPIINGANAAQINANLINIAGVAGGACLQIIFTLGADPIKAQ
jgi:hypothetical protein